MVPIIISTNDYRKLQRIAKVLKPYFTEENLFVISSDFSHYPNYDDACKVDARTGKAVESGDVGQLIAVLEENAQSHIHNLATSACGEQAIVTLLLMMDKSYEVRHLLYQNSGDADRHDRNRVVGYHAFAITRGETKGFSLTDDEKRMLKEIALTSIKDSLDGKPISHHSPLTSHHSPLTSHLSPLTLYTSFTYAHRRGYYGRRSPYTITFTNHDSHVYRFDARLSLTTPRARLYTSMSLNAENLENLSRNRRELKNDAGATHYEYYTPTKTANHLWVDGEVNVTAHLLPLADEPLTTPGTVPQWTLQGGLRWAHQKQTAWGYPYCRRQHFTTYEPFLELERNLLTHHGIWTLGASMALRHGHGTPAADTTLIPPSDKQTPPPTMETYLWREWQWMNAAQYELGASVRYAFTTHLLSMTTQQLFVKGAVTHRKCNERNAFTAGPDHTTMTVTIGCVF